MCIIWNQEQMSPKNNPLSLEDRYEHQCIDPKDYTRYLFLYL